ncbi:hypothetical protein STVA_47920 [Allostella vacuolata]|nr:hypothetical protein STVA_47920 [Stella vacuolata]
MRIFVAAMAGALLLMGCVDDQARQGGPSVAYAQPAYVQPAYGQPGYIQTADAGEARIQLAQGRGLEIYNADYGERGRFCNAERSIARECNGRRGCEFEVGNHLCGDPAPNQVKELRLSFGCEGRRGSDQDSTRAREGQRVRLECERGQAQAQVFGRPAPGPGFGGPGPGAGRPGGDRDIRVLDARYGSRSRACNAAPAVAQQCNGRDRCGVRVDNALCGDPAFGEPKVLDVTYSCGRGDRRQAGGREGQRAELRC